MEQFYYITTCVLFAVLGMVLYYPARPLNRLIARSKEKSGIM